MATDTPNSLTGFPLAGSVSASTRPTRLEDEVVALFDQLRAPVFRYLLSLRIAIPDAEEIIQEVFLSLFRHLKQEKSRANLQAWVFKVAHNIGVKRRAQAWRESQRFSDVDPALAEDSNPGPEETLAARQRQQQLMAVVRALPEQDQWCLSLRAEGLRYREISEVLGMSLGSVASSLEKSLARLTRAERI